MNRKLECIMTLISKEPDKYREITEWMIGTRLANRVDVDLQKKTRDRAEFLYSTLKNSEKEEKILLLDFEWSILPLEYIRITCVTDMEKIEFTYGV